MPIKKLTANPWVTTLLKLLVAGGILTWLITSGKFDPTSLKKISQPVVWLAGLGVVILALVFNTWRWVMLLRFEKVNLGYIDAYALSLMGIFFNYVIPGGVGGDVVKAGYLFKRYKDKKWFIGWATLMDRILGLTAALLYAAIMGVLFHGQLGEKLGPTIFIFSLLALVGFVAAVLIILLAPKKQIEKLLDRNATVKKILWPPYFYFSQPKRIVVPFLLSFVGQFFMISTAVVMGMVVNPEVPFYIYYMLVPIGYLSTIIPITPAGLGIGQAAYTYLFLTVTGDGELGFLAISFNQALQFLVGLVGGGIFVMYGKKVEVPANG